MGGSPGAPGRRGRRVGMVLRPEPRPAPARSPGRGLGFRLSGHPPRMVAGRPPFLFAAARYGATALILIPIATLARASHPTLTQLVPGRCVWRRSHSRVVPVSSSTSGEETTSGGLAAVLTALVALWSALLGYQLLPREQFGRVEDRRVAVGFGGVGVLVLTGGCRPRRHARGQSPSCWRPSSPSPRAASSFPAGGTGGPVALDPRGPVRRGGVPDRASWVWRSANRRRSAGSGRPLPALASLIAIPQSWGTRSLGLHHR